MNPRHDRFHLTPSNARHHTNTDKQGFVNDGEVRLYYSRARRVEVDGKELIIYRMEPIPKSRSVWLAKLFGRAACLLSYWTEAVKFSTQPNLYPPSHPGTSRTSRTSTTASLSSIATMATRPDPPT